MKQKMLRKLTICISSLQSPVYLQIIFQKKSGAPKSHCIEIYLKTKMRSEYYI